MIDYSPFKFLKLILVIIISNLLGQQSFIITIGNLPCILSSREKLEGSETNIRKIIYSHLMSYGLHTGLGIRDVMSLTDNVTINFNFEIVTPFWV